MAHKPSFGLPLAMVLLASLGISSKTSVMAQAPACRPTDKDLSAGIPSSRLAGDWHTSEAVAIPAGKPPVRHSGSFFGAVPASMKLDRMLLLLEPSAAQAQSLTAELENQQNPASPEYHHWLTPTAFAATYANSTADVTAVIDWLHCEGFEVAPLPAGRGWIEFSGTVAQVEQAFHTQIDSDGTRAMLASEISVPAALRPLVHGLASVDGALSTPAITRPLPVAASPAELAAETSLGRAEALTPQLVAQLLHLDALHSAGTNGAGETIAIAGRSNVRTGDVADFRAAFALPTIPLTIIANGSDPGPDAGLPGDQANATLAASWAGAAAPSAHIVLVSAATTAATDGLDLSLAAVVDQALAHTVAVGYSVCEVALSETHQVYYAALYRQAAAEGIAVISATGDSGPSACHVAGSDARVASGFGVNALASTPWNTAAGVAAFGTAGPAAGDSALSAWSPASAADPAYAGGGGSSTLYAAPGWQPFLAQPLNASSGIGAQNRLLPDLALPTAIDATVNPGLAFCLSARTASSSCTLVRSGGSSGAAALFAGIAALVAQKYGPQGNLAPSLYALSRQSGIFNDVQHGSAQLFCVAGSPGCGPTQQIGFSAGAGYDLATGLGTVDANALVTHWASPEVSGTGAVFLNFTTNAAQNNNPTASITFTATVTSGTGGAPPTGTVLFYNTTTGANLSATASALGSNETASLTVEGVFAVGGNDIEAIYSGDATYASATSQPLNVSIEPSFTTLAVTPSTATPAAGQTITATASVTAANPGTVAPTGKVTMDLDGLPTATASVATAGGVTSAAFSVVIPSGGTHTLQAVYAGDANYEASTSPAVTLTASKGATVTSLAATPAVLTAGTTETLTATIAPANAASGTNYSITGTVSFYDGTTLLGTGVANQNAASLSNVNLSTATTHTVSAVYSGDTSWAASTSNAITLQAVLLPDSMTLSVSPGTAAPGQVVTMVATVTPSSVPAANIEQNPTGNVTFYDGTTVLATVALVPSLNYTSTATLISGTLPGGQDVLTAVYVGDLYYKPATSNAVTIGVQDFTITSSPANPATNLNIIQGASGSASFIVTGLGGFNNQIQVVCAVPQQDDMTCTSTPQQVVPTATVTFVVQTFTTGGPSSTTTSSRSKPLWPPAAGGTALAVLGFFLLPFGRRARIFIGRSTCRFLVLFLLLVGLGGAGIGCNSSSAPVSTGTPLGVATLKITASAYIDNTVVSHSVYLTVNVLPPGSTTP